MPGPPFPLYLAGAELVAAYPMGPIMDGAGLNITVLSYRDHIDIGFMADKDLVPDVWDLAEEVQPAFEELKALAGNERPDPGQAGRSRSRRHRTSARAPLAAVAAKPLRGQRPNRASSPDARPLKAKRPEQCIRCGCHECATCSSFSTVAYNIADLFEHTVDVVPDRIALDRP